MASTWIVARTTRDGERRHRVLYRLGGRESAPRYAGSFKTKSEAVARKQWVSGELAARRVPNLASLETETRARTLAEACERWRASRVDVSEGTRVLHRVALARVTPLLGQRRVDELTVEHVNELVTHLSAAGKKRETIRKSVKYVAAVLEEEAVDPNPARSKRIRLPHEEPGRARSAGRGARRGGLPPAAACLPAAAALDRLVGGAGRLRRGGPHRRLRRATAPRPPARLDDEDALFPGVGADKLRTLIGRAARAAAVPTFSPHDLRHRRISLLHRQGADVGGDRPTGRSAEALDHGRHLHARPFRRARGRRSGPALKRRFVPGALAWCVPRCYPRR